MQNKYTISVIICSALFIFNTRTNPAHFLWRHRILHDWTGLKHSQLLEISGTTPRLSVYLTCSAGSCSCVCVRARKRVRVYVQQHLHNQCRSPGMLAGRQYLPSPRCNYRPRRQIPMHHDTATSGSDEASDDSEELRKMLADQCEQRHGQVESDWGGWEGAYLPARSAQS